MKAMLEKKINKFATGGLSQILMAVFMLYMTGQGLNIITIIFTF